MQPTPGDHRRDLAISVHDEIRSLGVPLYIRKDFLVCRLRFLVGRCDLPGQSPNEMSVGVDEFATCRPVFFDESLNHGLVLPMTISNILLAPSC